MAWLAWLPDQQYWRYQRSGESIAKFGGVLLMYSQPRLGVVDVLGGL